MLFGYIVLISILVMKCVAFEEIDMTCNDDYCTAYIQEKGCPKLSEACLAQNSTHNGIFLPFPDICNCCEYCVEYLKLDDVCVRGSPGLPPPNAMCGPGLTCTRNTNGPATCQPMKTPCMQAQADYDERRQLGTVGMMEVRPKCGDDGEFAPVHCIPGSICYCISPDGDRIFGEMPFLSPSDEHEMTCGCSLNNWKALRTVDPTFIDLTLTARCNDYGLYDPLQCMMGEQSDCLCVDPITGDPKADTAVVPIAELGPGKLACFDSSIHVAGKYETECEIMKMKWHNPVVTTTMATNRVDQFEVPQCQPDGKFHRVQQLGTNLICVDPSGRQINKYEAAIGTPAADHMNCGCARSQWLLSLNAQITELPRCCSDGSFELWQNRRNDYFCVDENGDQIGVEKKDPKELSCYNSESPCKYSSPL